MPNTNNLKLSVVIPCYNCATTLEEAVESCYLQGFTEDEFEIILVDDASLDSTFQLMQRLTATHKNIRPFRHDQNRGGGATRNSAVDYAIAEIIFCLDSDDLLPPHTLDKMHDFLLSHKADAVGVATSTKFKGTNKTDIAYITNFASVGEKIPLEQLLQHDGQWCSLYSVFMFTKSAFKKAGGYPTHHGFDTQGFAWRFLAAGLSAYVCPETNYLHRVNYNHSYYLREYDSGKSNINWQYIFYEHFHLFTTETQGVIRSYKVSDFTRSLYEELRNKDHVFVPEKQRRYGTSELEVEIPPHTIINRNSWRGIILRAQARLRHNLRSSRFRDIIVDIIMFKDDVVARLQRRGFVQRLLSYGHLRMRRWRKEGFYVQCANQEQIIDIVIPTIAKDQRLLETYLQHLRTHLCQKINNVYLVAPSQDESVRNFADKNNLSFIDEKSVLGYGKEKIDYFPNDIDRRGWLFQQLLKLSGEKFVSSPYYAIVDSDTLLIRPQSFFSREKFVLYENTEWHAPYFDAFENLFGYSAPHPLSLTSHMMIFSVEMLAEMKQEIVKKHGTTWDQAYINSCDRQENSGISDYDTYGQWLTYRHPKKVLHRPLYNKAFARTKLTTLHELEAESREELSSLSFHSYT